MCNEWVRGWQAWAVTPLTRGGGNPRELGDHRDNLTNQGPGPSFTKGRKFCRRRRRKRILYVRIYVCVESVLLKAVSSIVWVNFRENYDWSSSMEIYVN